MVHGVHFKSNETLNFCCFRCATTSLASVFYKLRFTALNALQTDRQLSRG